MHSTSVNAICHLHLCDITLEMMYFRAELVQLTVSWSDSGLEVQRYGMILSWWKMNYDETDNVKNCPQTTEVSFENQTAEKELSVFKCILTLTLTGSVFTARQHSLLC